MHYTTNRNATNEEASDASLIACVAERDHASFVLLMQRYKSRLFAFACKYTRDEDIALDMVQETFARVFSHAAKYNPAFAPSTWIFNITLNLCRDYNRRSKLRRCLSLDWMQKDDNGHDSAVFAEVLEDQNGNVESLLEVRDRLTALDKAINELPHDLKAALILFHLEEHSQQECAKQLGITVKTVETRVYRARKILRKKLSPALEG